MYPKGSRILMGIIAKFFVILSSNPLKARKSHSFAMTLFRFFIAKK